MILTVDIGNTTIALTGLDSGYNVLFNKKIPSDESFREPLKKALGGLNVHSAVVSSVVPTLTEPVCKAVSEFCGAVTTAISAKTYSDVLSFAIPEPEKLGLDRIADSAWAAVKYKLPVVTADLGTASTFNVIDEGKIFLGGVIAAGIQTSLRTLSECAAQLPEISLCVPKNIIGKNTYECMLSGAVIGAAAMTEGMISRIERELKKPVTPILTGGGAEYVKPFLSEKYIYEPFLLAKGLAMAAELSK